MGGPALESGPRARARAGGEHVKKLLMFVAVSILAVGCSSEKEPAQAAVTGLEAAVAAARPEIERFAADRMAGVDAAVQAVKYKLDNENYAGAIADVQGATNTLKAAAEAAGARKAQLSTDWAAFAGMPARVGQIKGRLAELDAMRRLPRGLDKARLDGAKSSLEAATNLWDEASDAHDDGHLVVAVAKARQAKPIVDSLMATLNIPTAAM
jgi:hypothetical protein